jgi:peptide deformylase
MRAMALRSILIIPDKRLRTKSVRVEKITADIRKLVDDMFETMYDAPGIGLAAIQVGVAKRVVTMDLGKRTHDGEVETETENGEEVEVKAPRVFINPEIVWSSDDTSMYEEGCLSIPEIHEDVHRPARVKVKFLDLDGKAREEEADGLYATCIQHEIDHLNGVLFIDHISKLKRDRIVKKFTKAAKKSADE